MINDGYLYIKSTEKQIPIPTGFVDVVFTMNSMDHTDNFEIMSKEILRILKPNGEFIGSFNMNESATPCELQKLTFELIEKVLLSKLEIKHQLTAFNGNFLQPQKGTYDCFFDNNCAKPSSADKYILWVRGKKYRTSSSAAVKPSSTNRLRILLTLRMLVWYAAPIAASVQ
jgi:SAM-dependent methyltransferase